MRMPWWVAAALLFSLGCSGPPTPSGAQGSQAAASGYAPQGACDGCHAGIAKTYARTGMGRAFEAVTTARMAEPGMLGRYRHERSGRTYEVLARAGRYFARRSSPGPAGTAPDVIEREIHYILGSGSHARSFIHRTPQGRLIEAPIGWYPEGGGKLAMSPGYDQPTPLGFRRKISTDCYFCHNAYPSPDPAAFRSSPEPVFPAALPAGIDCQRCHGPGAGHIVAAARPNADAAQIRAAIVNPARLAPDRALDVCAQCHLETTSSPLPNSLVRFDRGAFSFRPGEPLIDFALHFDHAPGTGREEKFEIVNSTYRLRQSRCFQASAGKLGCTTCHNPHDVPRGEAAVAAYAKACQSCHAPEIRLRSGARHPDGPNCAGCHMPKRRTEDVVHAVMTDHKIVRRPPPGNLIAPRTERRDTGYQGEVVFYGAERPRDAEVYLAIAQVAQNSNLEGGIARLEALAASGPQREPRVYFALAQALEKRGGNGSGVERRYREALTADPKFLPAHWRLGEWLHREGKLAEAKATLESALKLQPDHAGALYALALVERDAGRGAVAEQLLDRAIAADADFPQAHNARAGLALAGGDVARGRQELEEALRQQPEFAEARANLAQVLAAGGDYAAASAHTEAAVRSRPDLASAWILRGQLAAMHRDWARARQSLERALQLDSGNAQALLALGTVLAAQGDVASARRYLTQAAGKPATAAEARELLNALPSSGGR